MAECFMRVISGSGRSGTTWVLDCLAEANGLRPIFEPLHPAVTPFGRDYAYRAIEPDELHPVLAAYLYEVDCGLYRSWWLNYRGRRDLLTPTAANLRSLDEIKRLWRRWRSFLRDKPALQRASRRSEALIKFIRANLALGWMVRTFDARAVLIVRHPCAVVESQRRLGSIWDPWPILNRFRADAVLDKLTEGRYRNLLRAELSILEALTLVWVIENQSPVARAAEHRYQVVFYEDLVERPAEEWQRICTALALSRAPDSSSVRRPSQQASMRDEDFASRLSAPKWISTLTRDDLASIRRVLDSTDCHLYCIEQEAPLRS